MLRRIPRRAGIPVGKADLLRRVAPGNASVGGSCGRHSTATPRTRPPEETRHAKPQIGDGEVFEDRTSVESQRTPPLDVELSREIAERSAGYEMLRLSPRPRERKHGSAVRNLVANGFGIDIGPRNSGDRCAGQ